MNQPLPALSGLDKAGLQAAYFAETGKDAGGQTADELRDALKAYRAANPATPAAGDAKAAPGSPDFDVDNATDEEYEQHAKILRRRAEVAGLTPTPLTAVTSETTPPAEPAPLVAGPGEVLATHPDRGERVFSDLAWETMRSTKDDTRDGWEVVVEKPALATK